MTIVITRHAGLVTYLRETGLLAGEVRILAHAGPDDVLDRHVIGVLPLHLAALAESVTEVPLRDLPVDLRGAELSADQVRQYAGPATRYVVREVCL